MRPETLSVQIAELREAWKLAALAHGEQKYVMDGTSMPYLGHVGDVAAIAKEGCLQDLKGDPHVTELVGILHDSVEDGVLERITETIQKNFGNHVVECVLAVSKNPELRGRAASEEAVARIMKAPIEAGIVKLADRICNIGGLPRKGWSSEKVHDYLLESEHIMHCLGDKSPTLSGVLEQRINVWREFVRKG